MDNEERKLIRRLERAREAGKLDDWEICCRRLAELRVSYGHYEEALQAYQEELSVCETKEDVIGIANAHRMVGEMLSTLGRFQESLVHVHKYLDQAQKSNNSVERQRAYATIGRTYFCWASELYSINSMKTAEKIKASEVLNECRKAYNMSLYICENELRNVGVREKQEMKARILFNIGLASDLEDNFQSALSYISKSIAICKQVNLLEDLHRCYINQGTILLKLCDYSAALSAIDLACDVAKKLPNTTELTVYALLQKSEIYFAMGNYTGAKKSLKKAYKMKSPNEEDRKSVEKSLKQALVLCGLEQKLTNSNGTLMEKKDLNEKFGDACCAVKNFRHAIQCYRSMLEYALQLGHSGKELQPCYVSLYQTYRDNKEYDLALEYARKELEIVDNEKAEKANSLIAIGEILELKGAPYQEVLDQYLSARELAQQSGDSALIASALKRIIATHLANGFKDLASALDKDLEELGVSDTEDTQSDDQDILIDGIHLSDLSDSDEERTRAARSSRNTFRVTRNEKGETPLHVAAIKGDVARAERLLNLGHPVKERDSAGWTPLHEAANHGHVDMVRTLLKAGANINDAGGKECGGVTPLHDAATCGNFEVVKILLEHNASVTVITENGETPLDCLKAWRSRVENLCEEDEEFYYRLVQDLDAKLLAAGFQHPAKNIENKRYQVIDREKITKKRTERSNSRRELESRDRRRSGWDDWDDWTPVSPDRRQSSMTPPRSDVTSDIIDLENIPPSRRSPSPSISSKQPIEKSVSDYRSAMDALRKRPAPANKLNPKPRVDTALLDESSYVDDWLEDDLRMSNLAQKKKRKVSDLVDRSGIRARPSLEDNYDDCFLIPGDSTNVSTDDDQNRKRPKLQSTLLDAGFEAVPCAPVNEISDTSPSRVNHHDDYPNLPSPPFSSVSDQTITKVRVDVGRFTLLVPVDNSRVDELTVKWLAEEAARRYSDLEGAEPQLLLKTKDGAILAPTDPVSVALGEDIDSTVTGWKTANLTDRYRDAVLHDSSTSVSTYGSYIQGPDMAVMERLAACESSHCLDLSYISLTAAELAPVFRSLKHERGLKVLNLAGNVLGDAGLETMMNCLEHCSVEQINLRCNNITGAGLSNLVDSLGTMSKDFLEALHSLDLSFNPLGNSGDVHKEKLLQMFPNLSQFKTEYCESDV